MNAILNKYGKILSLTKFDKKDTKALSDEQVDKFLNNKNYSYFIIDDIFVEKLIISKKRLDIVVERDECLQNLLPYFDIWYQEKLLLTTEQIEDIKELYYRLLDAPQHYDSSEDKEAWCFNFVDEYTSGKNTNKYQIKKLDFIKW